MPLYEKFGLDSKLFSKERFKNTQESLLTCLNKKPPHISLISTYKSGLVFDSSRICLNYYLIDEKERIKHYVKPIFDYALDYFFGEWRKTTPVDGKVGEEFVKRCELWVRYFRELILWASVLGEWDKAKEISRYPDDLCMEAGFESKEKKAWYILLAVYLREDSLDNAGKYVDLIENGKKKRERLLLKILRTIIAKDADGFTKEFNVYLKYYKSHEYTQSQIPEKLAIDGTIMLNLAKHKGLSVEFPRKYIDHYVYLD
jgi:hypothetical protein